MEQVHRFTNDREADWNALCKIWLEHDEVMSQMVGARWEMPPQHKVCLEFAEAYPDSKAFLIYQMGEPDPRIAAYAFKILIRVCDLKREDVAEKTLRRKEKIRVRVYSRCEEQTLDQFFARYFDDSEGQSIEESDRRAVSWQDNELARYKRATGETGS